MFKKINNILFIVEPWIEKNNIKFRLGAYKNQIKHIIKGLINANPDLKIKILIGEGTYYSLIEENFFLADTVYIRQNDLEDIFPDYLTASHCWYEGSYSEEQLNKMQELVRKVLINFEPEIILSWETLIPYLENLYPNALALNLMPGMFSRAPYPEIMSIDPCGYFKNSFLCKYSTAIKNYNPTQEEIKFVEAIKFNFHNFFKTYNPIPFILDFNKLNKSFKKLLLLPLQVSNYFAFNSTSEFKNQHDLLKYVLENTPKDIGIIVTQYVTPNIQDTVLNKDNYKFYIERYKNLIYHPELDQIDSVSQYILPFVDGVVTVSSSIGFQALLWDIPVFAIGNSYINAIADSNSLKDLEFILGDSYIPDFNKNSVLAFILLKYSLLNIEYIFNGEWFLNYLSNAYLKYHTEGINFEFHNNNILVSEYKDKFIISTKLSKALQNIKERISDKRYKELIFSIEPNNELEQKVLNPQFEIISFDIFDTCLCRPFIKPRHLFDFISEKIKEISNGIIYDFTNLRISSEVETREIYKRQYKYEDINIDEIYKLIQEKTQLSEDIINTIKELEISTETRFLYPRKFVYNIYKLALSLGKKIIFSSDMYLSSKTLSDILYKNGFTQYDKIYVSSEVRLKKQTGNLFDFIIKDLQCQRKSILHIGDNKIGDIEKCREKKFIAYHTPKAYDKFSSNIHNKRIWADKKVENLYISTIQGVVSNKLYDNSRGNFNQNSLFNGSAYYLGYYALGSLFMSFAKWILDQAIRDGMDTLYFLSRDGEIIKKACELLLPIYKNPPKLEYLYCSRRAVNVTNIFSEKDFSLLIKGFSNSSVKKFISSRLGLNPDLINSKIIYEAGYSSLKDEIFLNQPKDVQKLLNLMNALSEDILDNAKKERESFLKYLQDKKFLELKNMAIVDIGYAGSMQGGLLNLKKQYNPSAKLHAYYLMTFSNIYLNIPFDVNARGFLGELVTKEFAYHPLCKLGLSFESLFSNTEGSFVKMLENQYNESFPLLESTTGENKKIEILPIIHKGLLDFINDYVELFGTDMHFLEIDSTASFTVYLDYLLNPSLIDAKILEGFTFDNNYAGRDLTYLLANYEQRYSKNEYLSKSIWKKGAEIIYESFNNIKKEIILSPEKAQEKIILNGLQDKKSFNNIQKFIINNVEKVLKDDKFKSRLNDNPYNFFNESKKPLLKILKKFF